MDFSRQRPYLLAAAVKAPLVWPILVLNVTVPPGAKFRLDYVMVSFRRTVVIGPDSPAGIQTSPELLYQIFDSSGVALSAKPVPCALASSPGGSGKGGASVRALPKWGVVYAPSQVIRIEVTGQVPGPVPTTVSITLAGARDRMRG